MSKMFRNIIAVVVLLIMIGIIAFAMLRGKVKLPENNLWTGTVHETKTGSSAVSDDITSGIQPSLTGSTLYDEILALRPGRTAQLHQTIEFKFTDYFDQSEVFCDLAFTPNGYSVSKERKIDIKYYPYFDGMSIDENGTLTCDRTYYTANVTVKNLSDEVGDFCFNNLRLYSIQKDGSFESGGECFEYDAKDERTGKDFFLYHFQPHEEKTINLVFFIPDDMAENMDKSTLIINQGDFANPQIGTFAFLDFYEENNQGESPD